MNAGFAGGPRSLEAEGARVIAWVGYGKRPRGRRESRKKRERRLRRWAAIIHAVLDRDFRRRMERE